MLLLRGAKEEERLQYILEGRVTFLCSVMVIHNSSSVPVPPSDIGIHLGRLLDHTEGTDVAFNVDGETFHAHRAVLAARSPLAGLQSGALWPHG